MTAKDYIESAWLISSIGNLCIKQGLKPFDREKVKRVLEYVERRSEEEHAKEKQYQEEHYGR